jgi:hypothetical protein
MTRAIRVRLAVAFEEVRGANLAQASLIQSRALTEQIGRDLNELDDTAIGDIAAEVSKVPWLAEHLQTILASLSRTVVKKARRHGQDCYSQDHYTEVEWRDVLLSADVGHHVKLQCILNRQIKLRCQLPSENSFKQWCALWLIACQGGDEAERIPIEEKGRHLQHIKQEFGRMKRAIKTYEEKTNNYVFTTGVLAYDVLPGAIADLRFADQVYKPDHPPVPCQLSFGDLQRVAMTFGCRGNEARGGKTKALVVVAKQAASVGGMGDSMAPMGAFANMMFEGMGRILSCQQAMMNNMNGGAGSESEANQSTQVGPAGSRHSGLRLMAENHGIRRLPTLNVGDATSCLPGGGRNAILDNLTKEGILPPLPPPLPPLGGVAVGNIGVSPPALGGHIVADGETPAAPLLDAAAEQAAAPVLETPAPVGPLDLVEMLQAREEKKKKEAKAASALERAAKKTEKKAPVVVTGGSALAPAALTDGSVFEQTPDKRRRLTTKCRGSAFDLATPTTKKKDEKTRFGKPNWCFENSRDQVLCRTGLRGKGQSQTYKFGGSSGRTKEEAQALAEIWIKARVYIYLLGQTFLGAKQMGQTNACVCVCVCVLPRRANDDWVSAARVGCQLRRWEHDD